MMVTAIIATTQEGEELYTRTESMTKKLKNQKCIICGQLIEENFYDKRTYYDFWPKSVDKFCHSHMLKLINFLRYRLLKDKRSPNGDWKRKPNDSDILEFVTYNITKYADLISKGEFNGFCEVDGCVNPQKKTIKGMRVCGLHYRSISRSGWGTPKKENGTSRVVEMALELLEV